MKPVKFSYNKQLVAFARINRQYKENKSLINSIDSVGLLTKLMLVRTDLMLESGYELYDPISNEVVNKENSSSYPYTVIDGQHRYLSVCKVNEGRNENDYKVPTISGELYTSLDDFPNKDINAFIIALNTTSRSWNNSDYIQNKAITVPNNQLIETITMLDNCKFSITTISLILANNKRTISRDSLYKYVPGENPLLDEVDFKKGVDTLRFLLDCGFDVKYLRSRYIWEFLTSFNSNEEKYLALIKYASTLDNATDHIEQIENLKDDIDGIAKYLKNLKGDDSVPGAIALNLSYDKFNENCAVLRGVAAECAKVKGSKNKSADIVVGGQTIKMALSKPSKENKTVCPDSSSNASTTNGQVELGGSVPDNNRPEFVSYVVDQKTVLDAMFKKAI